MAVPLRKAITATSHTRDPLEPRKSREQKREHHHGRLRNKQQPPLVHAVGNHAAEEREEKKRNGARKAHHAQPERGVGKHQHQPALGHVLHPRADVGEKVAAPEEPEVGVAKGADNLWAARSDLRWHQLLRKLPPAHRTRREVLFIQLADLCSEMLSQTHSVSWVELRHAPNAAGVLQLLLSIPIGLKGLP